LDTPYDTSSLAWLRRVFETMEEEISCTQCAVLVSRYVHLEQEGADAAAQIPELVQHLDQCPACWESYQTLSELARLENGAGLPEIQGLIEWLGGEE
jgi:hypothetical protein